MTTQVSSIVHQVRDLQDRLRTFKSGSVHWPIFLHMPPDRARHVSQTAASQAALDLQIFERYTQHAY